MKVSFEGVNEKTVTFEADGTVAEGVLVKLSANGKVTACSANGDIPVGMAVSVHNGYASVRIGGYIEAPCASALTLGVKALGVDSAGKLAVTSGGRSAIVVSVNSGSAGVIL